MRKRLASESGLFNGRALLAFGLCAIGIVLALLAQAGTTRIADQKTISLREGAQLVSLSPDAPAAPANTITVNSTSPVIANDGTCTLPEAIIAANTDTPSGSLAGECSAGSGADTIVLQTGATYSMLAAHNSTYGFNGLPQVTSNIFIQGNGAIIERSANAPTNFRLLYIAPGGNLTLRNVTVRTGIAKGGNGGSGSAGAGGGAGLGGAIYNQGALTVDASTLTGNRAQGGNGGLSAAGLGSGGGGLGGDGGTSTGATPGGGGGGGMGGNGGASNGSGGGGGGGANLNEHGQPNAGPQGGAGGGTTGGAGGNGTPLVGTSGANGGAGGGGGGGGNGSNINNGGNGGIGGGGGGGIDATAAAGTGGFGGGGGSGGATNSFGGAGGFGGGGGGGGAAGNFGLGGFGGGKALFDGGGGGGMGGAIFNDGGTLFVTNSTLSGNTAIGGNNGGGVNGISGTAGDGLGGGIFNYNGSVTIDFSSVVSNTVTPGPKGPGGGGTLGQARGGALYNYTTNGSSGIFVRNSIISESIGATDCVNDAGATFTSTGYNLSRLPGTCSFTATGDLTGADPKLHTLSNNGGPTSTHALFNSSPAVDRIPNGVNGCQKGVSFDQRGAPRAGGTSNTGGTACDSGSYELNATPGGTPAPTPTPGPRPRFFTYLSPTGIGDSAGEPSIGSNWTREQIFTNHNVNGSTNSLPNGGSTLYFGGFLPSMLKVTFNDCSSPASALWEEKPLLSASAPRAFGDPILFTDHDTGRTFVCQLEGLTPGGSTIDITDDDGDNFIPSDGVIPSDIDHETIGGGIYHASDVPIPHPLYQNAIYYASQSVSDARALRSDNGGLVFSQAASPMYTVNDCAGLHGHIKVSPADGTVYVPNVACGGSVPFHETGGRQTLLVSENNGITWTQRPIPDSTTTGNGSADNAILGTRDPSVGVATDGTVYFGYQGADGHPRIAVSHNKGQSWSPSVDVGATVLSGGPVLNCAFPAVVAGDPNRAAFAFFGTETGGENWQCGQGDDCSPQGSGVNARPAFTGVWYLYVASTYDGGVTWTTQNITPGDPIQRGGICQSSTCRNLLDFFDVTIDKEGRILIGYDDGCVTASCINGTKNDFTAKAAIARQSGGKRMFSAFDPPEPVRAGAPVLSGSLNEAGDSATLKWTPPDNGGATITSYKIYRKISTDTTFTLIATTPATNYTDGTLNPSLQYNYHVTAVNSAGEGPYCSDVTPVFVPHPTIPPACRVPGVLAVNDVNEDGSDNDSAQNTPPDARVNVRSLSVAEPCFGPGVNKLVFTMQLAPSTAGSAPPSSQWYIIWNRKEAAADGSDRRYVAMKTDATGALNFDYGNFGPALPIGGVPPPNANTPTSLGSADSGTYDVATGVVTITLSSDKADDSPGLMAGDSLTGLNVRTYLARPDAGQKSQNNANDITGDGIYTLFGNGACCGPVPLLGVASRKAHGSVGEFDIPLPLTGNPGVECRSGGANGEYKIVFTFANPVTTVTNASITSGSGSIASSSVQNTYEYVVNLTGVQDRQRVTVTLDGVRDTAGDRTDALVVTMGVLFGDVTSNGTVTGADVSNTKAQVGAALTQSNFRSDVTANGIITGADVSAIKAQVGLSLP